MDCELLIPAALAVNCLEWMVHFSPSINSRAICDESVLVFHQSRYYLPMYEEHVEHSVQLLHPASVEILAAHSAEKRTRWNQPCPPRGLQLRNGKRRTVCYCRYRLPGWTDIIQQQGSHFCEKSRREKKKSRTNGIEQISLKWLSFFSAPVWLPVILSLQTDVTEQLGGKSTFSDSHSLCHQSLHLTVRQSTLEKPSFLKRALFFGTFELLHNLKSDFAEIESQIFNELFTFLERYYLHRCLMCH